MNAGGVTPLGLAGLLVVETHDSLGRLTGRSEGDNIACVSGLTDLATAVAWAGVQDLGAEIGALPAFLTPLFGAVGTGTGTPATTDSALYDELARATAVSAGSAPANPGAGSSVIWQFQFAINNMANFTITEAGTFTIASSTLGSGDLLDHAVLGSPISWPTGESLTLSAQFTLAHA